MTFWVKLMVGVLGAWISVGTVRAQEFYSGIYPHLAFFNDEGECGTGAVVPWAGRLWAITYAPHKPRGSSDKLYEIDKNLNMTVRSESVGGTNANRMIHRESQQLFIGLYVIDKNRKVRVIPSSAMFGRMTGNARHLSDPANKIYYATMEEGIYEVDVKGLQVKTLFVDEQVKGDGVKANLPGYHGKGLYSGQGRLIYSNNGEHGKAAKLDPFVHSGVLAEWGGEVGEKWKIIQRNQFTEVTGPGGIYGSENPASDAVWSVGWDAKSLLVMLLEEGKWHRYRLPKASHTYDGAHGWNTEWPRIRDIGEDDLLMTMHGMFWRFPKTFSTANSAGILPRSTYLKVVGDFCQWQGQVVLGCDDTARSEFLNKRKAKGEIAAPQSQSNLWFLEPEQLDQLGPVIGRGAVWLNEDVPKNQTSDPFLFNGFKRRALHLSHTGKGKVSVDLQIDREGNGEWAALRSISLDPGQYLWTDFEDEQEGVWIRLKAADDLSEMSAWFTYSGEDARSEGGRAKLFAGLAMVDDDKVVGGVIRARNGNRRTLQLASSNGAYYELGEGMKLRKIENKQAFARLQESAAVPSREGILSVDAASVLYIDDKGGRFRLPKGDAAYGESGPLGWGRLAREVATERDLFNCHGTFYELPAENAGGFARVRPVSSHHLRVADYCSYRGLLVMSGVDLEKGKGNSHIIYSDDKQSALWVGAIDDIWKLGKPVGEGGPWKDSKVNAGQLSDAYLMTGYDRKALHLQSSEATNILMQVDITGRGDWKDMRSFVLDEGGQLDYEFPESFQAYWVRFVSAKGSTVSAQLSYR
ncbi:MAG: hypothetical protein L3J39_12380 [Verrucomicrobiales bacterium]|nr:hypothetical protein [Verrucomicrobiales bacterium]